MNNPNPGSKEAIELGCECAVLDNNYGRGMGQLGPDGETQFYIDAECPIHGGPVPAVKKESSEAFPNYVNENDVRAFLKEKLTTLEYAKVCALIYHQNNIRSRNTMGFRVKDRGEWITHIDFKERVVTVGKKT